jgi:tRNA(Ile)-lysidine synthase
VSKAKSSADSSRRAVFSYIEREAPWPAQSRLVVAVSGGADSLCLLGLLVELQNSGHTLAPAELIVAHLDHGLRGEAGKSDALWVGELAERLNLSYFTEYVDIAAMARAQHRSVEDAGRRARYAFLRRVAARTAASCICTGHTADDQAETIVMHWLRGSGASGLSGMKAISGDIARPLLCIAHADTLAYCHQRDWTPRHDPTNEDTHYHRNRVRHELLPYLERYNPNLRETLVRNAALLASDEAYLEKEADRVYTTVCREETEEAVVFGLDELTALYQRAPALARRVVRRGARHLVSGEGDFTLEAEHIFQIERQLTAGETGTRLSLPASLVAERGYTTFLLKRMLVADPLPVHIDEILLPVPGECAIPTLGWRLRARVTDSRELGAVVSVPVEEERVSPVYPVETVAYLDWEACGEKQLFVRTWQKGDRFRPLGMRFEKKLHDYFIDARVPRALRHRIPLVVSPYHIVWVAGLRIDDRVRTTAATTRVVVIQLEPLPVV